MKLCTIKRAKSPNLTDSRLCAKSIVANFTISYFELFHSV